MAEDKAPNSENGARSWPELWSEVGRRLVTLLISAGSLVGFVAFAGSVVLWTRFDAIGVPPEQVVDAVPRGEAVAVGSVMLLLFGFFGALATLVVYVIDRGGRPTPGMSRSLLFLVMVEGAAAIWIFSGSTEEKVVATEVVVIAVGAALWATFVGSLIELKKPIENLFANEEEQPPKDRPFRTKEGASTVSLGSVVLAVALAALFGALAGAVRAVADGSAAEVWTCALGAFGAGLGLAVTWRWLDFHREKKKEREEATEREKRKREQRKAVLRQMPKRARRKAEKKERKKERREKKKEERERNKAAKARKEAQERGEAEPRLKPPRFELSPYGWGVVVGFLAIAVVVPSWILGSSWLAASLIAVFLVGVGLWRISTLSKDKFLWYGLAVFLSVPLFGTLALMARNIENPQVQPVALIRSTDGPGEALQGIYVTETDDRVYFANVATDACGEEVVGYSGRLLWVPREEVVAMSVGPLQDVESAGTAAIEMAHALTPDIETSGGGLVSLKTEEEAADAGGDVTVAEEEGAEKASDHRLETAGPAVRPRFGSGLRLDPEIVSPGQPVELLMSEPAGEGFGDRPERRSLRLNGLKLPILREDRSDPESDFAWSRKRIAFRVPRGAESGVVTIACGQLVGQPFLTVSRAPTARVAVRVRAGSRRVTFDARRSSDDSEDSLSHRWTVAGVRMGHGPSLAADLPLRLAPYAVRLTVTDSEGQKDTVALRLLRLPSSRFPFGSDLPASRKAVRRVRQAVRKALNASRPAHIELHGHADAVGTERSNLRLAAKRVEGMRERLFDRLVNRGGQAPMTVRAFGETCPIVRRPGRQSVNRRVEVFLLDEGATVGTAKGCRAGHLRRTRW